MAQLTALMLGSACFAGPALAATFHVGGGTITTSQADSSNHGTGTRGGFAQSFTMLGAPLAGGAATVRAIFVQEFSRSSVVHLVMLGASFCE